MRLTQRALAFAVVAIGTAATFRWLQSIWTNSKRKDTNAIKKRAHRERTFIMVKPDGVTRGIVGHIVERFEDKGYLLRGFKMTETSRVILEKHYKDLKDKNFFSKLIAYMLSGPVVCMCWEGDGAVKTGRKILGETMPSKSRAGTIRGTHCITVGRNICHGSDSVESANFEIALWFKENELCDSWKLCNQPWVYEGK
eukprot:g30.t1